MNEIVKLNPAEYGIQEQKAAEIAAVFKPMLDKMVELETEFNQIVSLPITESTVKAAKELRLKYVKVRTGTAEIHKQQKAFYLAGGRFIDGWKNAQEFASQGIENKLQAIEKHFENLEKERLAALESTRREMLLPYGEIMPAGLGAMPESVFVNYLAGVKLAHEAKIQAELKAEQERIAKEKAEAAERARIAKENAELKAAAEKAAKERAAELAKIEAEREKERQKQAKILADQKAAAEKAAKIEAEKQAKIQAELKAKADAEAKVAAEKLAKERAEAARLAAELKAKQDAEAAAAKAKALAEKKAAAAPDKEKAKVFAKTLTELKRPEMATEDGKKLAGDIDTMLSKMVNYILGKISEM